MSIMNSLVSMRASVKVLETADGNKGEERECQKLAGFYISAHEGGRKSPGMTRVRSDSPGG